MRGYADQVLITKADEEPDLQPANFFAQNKSKWQHLKNYWLYWVSVVFVVGVFAFAYHPVLFNFYISDDFYYFAWLNEAIHHPEMVLQKYYTFWQGYAIRVNAGDAPVFYRPFFNTMLFLEYALWGPNSVYFRLVSMVVELLSGLMLGLVVIALNKNAYGQSSLSSQQLLIWALFSAALFILFPLHSEPVSWIAARMDPLVTLFSLFSMWSYIQWRNKSKREFFILSIISCLLAFLTKEMAVALPLTIFVYELLFWQTVAKKTLETKPKASVVEVLWKTIRVTMPYWLILVPYFCIRKILLGDFIAGYRVNPIRSLSISGWFQGLHAIFVPINTLIIGTHSYIFKTWHVALFSAILLTVICIFKANKHGLKVMAFLTIWFLLCLLPVCKVFPLTMSPAYGSRIAYLATAPVCILLTFGIATFSARGRFSFFYRCIALTLCILAAIVLYTNNLAFAESGHLTNKIVQEFKNYYRGKSGDPLTYTTGLPTFTQKGLDAGVSVRGGMAKTPFMERDLYNCLCLASNDENASFGFIKDATEYDKERITLLYWDSQAEVLKPIVVAQRAPYTELWNGNNLKKVLRAPSFRSISMPHTHWLNDGTVEIVSHRKSGEYTIVELNLQGLQCWPTDFLALKVQMRGLSNLGPFSGAELFFTNDIAKKYSKEYFAFDHCHANIQQTSQDQEIIFSLRNLSAWSLGGQCRSVRIVLPTDCIIHIKNISIPNAKTLMPAVQLQSFAGDPPGEIRLDKDHSTQSVKYDAHSIKGCQQVVLEVAEPLKFIQTLDLKDNSRELFLKKIALNSYGQFTITRAEFPLEKTVCRARLVALNKTGNQIGFPSDLFFVCVDNVK